MDNFYHPEDPAFVWLANDPAEDKFWESRATERDIKFGPPRPTRERSTEWLEDIGFRGVYERAV